MSRIRLAPTARGSLQVWQEPIEGRDYVVGSDTAGGGTNGDYSVAIALDAETCATVALWRDHMSPMPWGRAVSRLGWYFNTAFVGFETGVSSHGLAACHASIAYGYRRIFKRQNVQRADQPTGEQLGWATTATNKNMMIARVQEALEQDLDIPSEEMLRELSEQHWVNTDVTRKMACEKNDDMVMAYSIALLVRDRAWTSGLLKAAKPVIKMDESERFWHEREKRGQLKLPKRRMFA